MKVIKHEPLSVRRLLVLSPHLDDAAFSLGATIARAVGSGSDVIVATVFAGNPRSSAEAALWDHRCGFSTAGEAARQRRGEDAVACKLLGAKPVWLPFGDEQQKSRGAGDRRIWEALSRLVAEADLTLTPGYPLRHSDHAWLTRTVVEHAPAETALGYYLEQPYAAHMSTGAGYSVQTVLAFLRATVETHVLRRPFGASLQRQGAVPLLPPICWHTVRPTRREKKLKTQAIRAYVSQLGSSQLGRLVLHRMRLYEVVTGGEHIGFVRD